jgi:hypothetical protein
MKDRRLLTNFSALVQQRAQKRPVFTMKVTSQWALHGLIIQVVLIHYGSSLANGFQMQQ